MDNDIEKIYSSIIPAQHKKYSNKLKQQVYYQSSTAKDIKTFLEKWVAIQHFNNQRL